MLKLRDLRAVEAVAQYGSVSQASARLNLSQPAVTHTIKRVESRVGGALFERHCRGMVPTRMGMIVVNRVGRAFSNFAAARAEIEHNAGIAKIDPACIETLKRTVTRSHLAAMIEVSDARSIAAAAKKLNVTKTVVYRLLREVESIVEAPIVHRGSDFVTTPVGDTLVRCARLILSELRLMDDELQHHMGRIAGRVVIGTLPSSRTILVPSAIAALSRQYSDLKLTMLDEPYDNLVSGLACGDVDVIVGSVADRKGTENFEKTMLFREPAAIMAKADHALIRKEAPSLTDLSQARWVLPHGGAYTRHCFESMFRAQGIPLPRDVVETESLVAIRTLLIEDDRLSVLSVNRARFELDIGVFSVLPFELSDTSFDFGYTIRSRESLSPGAREFIRKITQLSHTQVIRRAK